MCEQELIDADNPSHAAAELADVVFFALTAANVRGASLADTDRQLDLRTLRVRMPHPPPHLVYERLLPLLTFIRSAADLATPSKSRLTPCSVAASQSVLQGSG